jgi:hypothetical protein
MKKNRSFVIVFCLLIIWGFHGVFCQDDLGIWKEFVESLRTGQFAIDQVQSYEGIPKERILNRLMNIKSYVDQSSSWEEWEIVPDIFPVGNQVHFIVSLGFGSKNNRDFCFTFLKEEDRWFYRHMENIFIRLDQTPDPPTSQFPDITNEMKAWQREEIYWSKIVYFYTVLSQEKGKEYFLNLMKDGMGYCMMAKTWVPFVLPQKAFILYLCWDQSRLRGNQVSLEKLTDQEALVKLQPTFFSLFKRTGHIKQQISFTDYRKLYETIWQDRAFHAGWNLEIRYEDPECLRCLFHFTKNPE